MSNPSNPDPPSVSQPDSEIYETDANAHRQASLENWEEAAPGWVRRQELMRSFATPVSEWMVNAVDPKPAQRILELAGGLGETGMMASPLVGTSGSVLISDQAQGMLDGARERASQLGLQNVEFQILNAEWIDLPLASVDAVLCRFGYMLMIDPLTALRETRRVLRVGGRLALAVWELPEMNPWMTLPARELIERGLREQENPDQPGPFALCDRVRLQELLSTAGFAEVELDSVEVAQHHPGIDEMWESLLDTQRRFHDTVLVRPEQEMLQIRDALGKRLERYTNEDGSIVIPGRALVASASA